MSASNGEGVTNHGSGANTMSFTLDSSGGNKNSGSDGGSSKRKAVEIMLLTVLCVVIWSLYLLPIIFYHIPVGVDEDAPLVVTGNTSNEQCFPYPTTSSGGECRALLTNTLLSLNCDPGETPLVLRDEEDTASQLLPLLNLLRPSAACTEAVVPFLCVFLFGLCDSSGVSIQPTSVQCEQIRDVLCPDQWRQAAQVMDLPDCSSFPAEQVSCLMASGNGLSGSGLDAIDNSTQNSPVTSPEPLQCREDFFREEEEGGACVPSCYTWKEYSEVVTVITDLVIGLSSVIGFIFCLAIIIISCIRFDRMFTFPSILVVYMTIDSIIINFFIIISCFDRPSLYCTSVNLIDSLLESTAFCVITGMAFLYTLLQLSLWWFFHTTAIFWKVNFPIHARSFDKVKYVHLAIVLVSLVVPLVPIITLMADFAIDLESDVIRQARNITFTSGGLGFRIFRFPPILCSGGDSDAVFYSTVLPVNILLVFGSTELVFIFIGLFKHFATNDSKKLLKISTPERKILIILCYYVVSSVFSLTFFTLATRNSDPFAEQLQSYFVCEGAGHDPSAPCDRSGFQQLAYPGAFIVANTLLSLFPVVNLVYAVNVAELRAKCRKWCGGLKLAKEGRISSGVMSVSVTSTRA